jgi:hypothetical protein
MITDRRSDLTSIITLSNDGDSPRCAGMASRLTVLTLMVRPIAQGWGVYLTNGQGLIRYRGLFSKQFALRYLQRTRATPNDRDHRCADDLWR